MATKRTRTKKPVWWWLSFADDDLPKGSQFLGVALVQATDVRSAVQEAWDRDINPGGQVMAVPYRDKVPPQFANRLLTRKDVLALQGSALNLGDLLAGRHIN